MTLPVARLVDVLTLAEMSHPCFKDHFEQRSHMYVRELDITDLYELFAVLAASPDLQEYQRETMGLPRTIPGTVWAVIEARIEENKLNLWEH